MTAVFLAALVAAIAATGYLLTHHHPRLFERHTGRHTAAYLKAHTTPPSPPLWRQLAAVVRERKAAFEEATGPVGRVA